MIELAWRLATVDPEASSAVRVIGHFDTLVASGAGLQEIVGGVASLAGRTARLVDRDGRLRIRVLADPSLAPCPADLDPSWPSVRVTPDGATLWLEMDGPVSTVAAVALERAAAAARAVLDRDRHVDRAQREPIPDLDALQRAATTAPWALHTLQTVADSASLRHAARTLHLHHSTLHERLASVEALLGWDVREPNGRLRLQLALAFRRARRVSPGTGGASVDLTT